MNVLQVTNHFYPCIGGVESVVLNLSKALVAKGNSTNVVCLNKCAYSKEVLPKKEKLEKINIFRIPFFDLKYYKIAPFVLNFVKDYDLIQVHGLGFFSDFLLLTKPLHKKPVVITTHGGIFHTGKLSLLKKFYFYVIQKALLGFADSVVAVSKSDRKLFSMICKNVELIENGIVVEKFSKLGRGKEKNTFLFVGRISKNKRLDLLLTIFAEVVKEVPSAKLYIVGEDWEGILAELKNLSKKLGLDNNVFFVGKVSDKKLLDFYSKSEFFVSASQYEGFGISVVEAMGSGCIPIVNNIESFSNIIENNKNGVLIDFDNIKNAKYKIIEMMNLGTLKGSVSKNAKNSAKKFSWGKKVIAYIDEYEKAIAKARGDGFVHSSNTP